MTLTREQVEEIDKRENSRVGLEVQDAAGQRFWITDVLSDEKLRVLGEDGNPYIWNPFNKCATAIKKPKREWGQK